MPSLNSVWIPTIAAVYTLVFVFLLYSWEHLFGTVSAIIRPKASRREAAQDKDQRETEYDDLPVPKKKKDKKNSSEKLRSDQVPRRTTSSPLSDALRRCQLV